MNAKILFSIAGRRRSLHPHGASHLAPYLCSAAATDRRALRGCCESIQGRPTLCGCYEFLLSYRVEVLSTSERQRAIYMFPLAVCALRPQCSRSGLDVSLFSHIFPLNYTCVKLSQQTAKCAPDVFIEGTIPTKRPAPNYTRTVNCGCYEFPRQPAIPYCLSSGFCSGVTRLFKYRHSL